MEMEIVNDTISEAVDSHCSSDGSETEQPSKGQFLTYKLFHPTYCALDIDEAADVIVEAGSQRKSFGVTALAVHGLVESLRCERLGEKINRIQMIMPDGQPIVWALNSFYRLGMRDKVSGPSLTSEVFVRADKLGLSVFLYGSTQDTLDKFCADINEKYPNITICGVHADRFRDATAEEDAEDIAKINASGAHIVLVGRGCPRQEHWVADHVGSVNSAMMAVGAAFDYHAGKLSRAPLWLQRMGLEWSVRLIQEPKRLWRRYLVTNTIFIYLFLKHRLVVGKP